MGCHGSWANNSSNLPNGLLPGTKTYVGRVIDEEIWSKAEDSIAELIARIQPDESAEERRKAIAYSIQSVIGKCFSCQVKIIKCLAEDNVVDISCNQIGGLGTLCFLKKMDNLINQDHLFKRSVILIKAWCYYESHILGARRGIVSTYALETLILYIFHVFDNSLSGQLEHMGSYSYTFASKYGCDASKKEKW